ncbi:MAG: hypothetical protein J6A01_00825, partial [Proteobacteria bacterium]|nr:hypothetical protein [Pseudomonadota bacterium]
MPLSDDCAAGNYLCEDSTLMQCLSGTTENNKAVFYWVKQTLCADRCNPEGTGCKCPDNCTNGCDVTGTECCEGNCQNGCDINGKCLCALDSDGKSCPNGCDSSGKTCCDEKCIHGCNIDGTCTCSEECAQCNEDGSCQCNHKCDNGCDATGETCCESNCQNGCDVTGKCLCPTIDGKTCPAGCDSSGKICCEDNCQHTCDVTGKCLCPMIDGKPCPNGCDSSGTICCKEECKNGCKNDGSCISVKSCDNGCTSNEYCNESENLCYLIDANWNHMDDRAENAPTQGKDCRVDKDCNSNGFYKGFCDSYLGYKCSTKCSDDAQCVDNNNDDFHYVCRKDGRCAPDEFVTVWDIDIHGNGYNSIDGIKFYSREDEPCDIAIDWGDNTKCGHWDDGTSETESCCNKQKYNAIYHNYHSSGRYTIRIKGQYKFWSSVDVDHMENVKYMLKEVKAFGPVSLSEASFRSAINLEKLSDVDIPDSSQLTSMNRIFENATFLNKNDKPWIIPLENWDVSK